MSQFDRARTEIHAQLESLRLQMRQTHNAFLDATIEFLADWYQAQVPRILAENPGLFSSLPDETRSALKRDVLGLVDDAPQIIRHHFGRADIWWDQKDPAAARRHYEYTMNGATLPAALDELLRFCMGSLLPIVERHGFNASGFVLRRPAGSDARAGRLPCFRPAFQASPRMCEFLNQYAGMHNTAIAAERALVEIDRDEARASDQILWEQT